MNTIKAKIRGQKVKLRKMESNEIIDGRTVFRMVNKTWGAFSPVVYHKATNICDRVSEHEHLREYFRIESDWFDNC